MTTWMPAEVFPPGVFLKEELEERGLSQVDLAHIIGRHPNTVNEIIAGKRSISPAIARALASAFGTSAELWMNLDSMYQLSRVSSDDDDTVSRRATLYAKAPITEMIRRGWIDSSPDIDVLETRVCQFFNLASIADEPSILSHAARKATTHRQPATPAQIAWLHRARHLAQDVPAEPFSADSANMVVDRLRRLSTDAEGVGQVAETLARAGIRFVIVEPLPGSRIDGACLWDGTSPIIAMSLRYDRIDNFWFVLFHELDHVRSGEQSFDIDMTGHTDRDDRPQREREADSFAAGALIPSREMDAFIEQMRPSFPAAAIETFAHAVRVHPGVVVGQLHHRGELPYTRGRKMLAPIRALVTSRTRTDGWSAFRHAPN